MNILSLNSCGLLTACNSIQYCCKLKAILDRIPPKTNIICLQETHTTHENIDHLLFHLNEKGWWSSFSHFTSNSSGVAILIKKSFSEKNQVTASDTNGRFILVSTKSDYGEFNIGSIYVPATRQARVEWLTNSSFPISKNSIVGGDWNLTCHPCKNSNNEVHFNDIKAFNIFCNEHNLVNITPKNTPHTFHHRFCPYSGLLDKFVASTDLPGIHKISDWQFTLSDHNAILMEWSPFEFSSNLWKLNPALLTKTIISEIQNY